MESAFPSDFTIRPSRILKCFVLASCVLAILVLVQLEVGSAWKLAGEVMVIAAGVSVYLNAAKLSTARAIVAFRFEPENGITLIHKDGRLLRGSLAKNGLVTSFLVLLNIKKRGSGAVSMILLPDSMDCDSYRRLRVILRLRGGN